MEPKNSQTHKIEIKHFKDVFDYCYLNGITDINLFINSCFKKGFDIEKYGLLGNESKIVEKEVIKEIKIEVPIEKIIEKEIRVEVPVETIKYVDREVIKEVPIEKVVEKIVDVYDKSKENELLLKIQQLENEIVNLTSVQETKKIFNENGDEKVKMLQGTLQSLKKQLSLKDETIGQLENKIKELENLKINQGAVFMKGSNLSQNL